jgi:type II secretory pathway pseudopilin PulG
MKPRITSRPEAGLNLFEVGVVVAILAILAAVFLSNFSLTADNHRVPLINCVNNLKQVGLAYRIWEGDNGDRYPMGVSVTNGGSMEMVATGNVVQTFLVMSNVLATPKILWCPADSAGLCASAFEGLANSNISYFINADVTNDATPQAILSGDGNFELGGKPVSPGLLPLGTNDPVDWTAGRHIRKCCLLIGDGSVQSVTALGLHGFFVEAGMATNRLAIP